MFVLDKLSLKGALTAKPYAFKIRAWELSSLETIDSNDHFNSSIYVQYKNSKIIRVLPKKVKNSISIISDVSRFSFDSLNYNRPSIVKNVDCINKKKFRNFSSKTLLLTSNNLDLSSLMVFKFFQNTNQNMFVRRELFSSRSYILFWNSFTLFSKFEIFSKLCFISSVALSVESVLLNVKIRLKYNKKQLNLFYCGFFIESNYSLKFLSLKIKPLFFILKSKSFINLYFFKLFKNITFVIGESLVRRFKNIISFFNFFKQRIKSCIVYFVSKERNYLGNQLIPLKVISKRILCRINKIFLTNLEDSVQTHKLKFFFTHYNTFTSFNTDFSKNSIDVFPISASLESFGIFIDCEEKIKKSNKFPGISVPNLAKVVTNCFNFFKYIGLVLSSFNSFLQNYLSSKFYTIILESLKDIKLLEEYVSILRTLTANISSFNFITYPNKLISEDCFRYSLNTKNSLTMLNCSRNQRKQSSNF